MDEQRVQLPSDDQDDPESPDPEWPWTAKFQGIIVNRGDEIFEDSTEGWTNLTYFNMSSMCNSRCPDSLCFSVNKQNKRPSKSFKSSGRKKQIWIYLTYVQSNALISISTQPQDCIRWCQTHWQSVGIDKNWSYSEKQKSVRAPLEAAALSEKTVQCISCLQGISAVTVQCLWISPLKIRKKDCVIWTVNSIWDVDTVLNKLLCTVEPIAIATDFWLWARSSEQSKSNDKCWENASPDSDRSSCADSKKAASWLHQQCLII